MITVCNSGIQLEELMKIEPIRPETAGKRWKAVPHGELVLAIKNEVISRGWEISQEMYSTACEGADMAGALLLNKVSDIPDIPGTQLSLGFVHSNAMRKALHLTVGLHVFSCCNGVCTGNVILNKKHNHTVDLPTELTGAIDRYLIAAKALPDTVTNLQNYELRDEEASEILMEAGRRQLVGWASIGRVDKEYRNPTFAEHGTGTSWSLLNAFTYAARNNISPIRQMELYNSFRELLPEVLSA